METLKRVGLAYIHVGQQATTLSGGEAQRVKLSKELSKRATGRTLYILDEPTTGLHFEDVRKLLEVLHELVDNGNSVLVIEHNLDVIKTADWVLDLGPEGGDGGGKIVARGTPEDVAKVKESWTGRYLHEALNRGHARAQSQAKAPIKAEAKVTAKTTARKEPHAKAAPAKAPPIKATPSKTSAKRSGRKRA
jgi:excinuclease ABC subunit A